MDGTVPPDRSLALPFAPDRLHFIARGVDPKKGRLVRIFLKLGATPSRTEINLYKDVLRGKVQVRDQDTERVIAEPIIAEIFIESYDSVFYVLWFYHLTSEIANELGKTFSFYYSTMTPLFPEAGSDIRLTYNNIDYARVTISGTPNQEDLGSMPEFEPGPSILMQFREHWVQHQRVRSESMKKAIVDFRTLPTENVYISYDENGHQSADPQLFSVFYMLMNSFKKFGFDLVNIQEHMSHLGGFNLTYRPGVKLLLKSGRIHTLMLNLDNIEYFFEKFLFSSEDPIVNKIKGLNDIFINLVSRTGGNGNMSMTVKDRVMKLLNAKANNKKGSYDVHLYSARPRGGSFRDLREYLERKKSARYFKTVEYGEIPFYAIQYLYEEDESSDWAGESDLYLDFELGYNGYRHRNFVPLNGSHQLNDNVHHGIFNDNGETEQGRRREIDFYLGFLSKMIHETDTNQLNHFLSIHLDFNFKLTNEREIEGIVQMFNGMGLGPRGTFKRFALSGGYVFPIRLFVDMFDLKQKIFRSSGENVVKVINGFLQERGYYHRLSEDETQAHAEKGFFNKMRTSFLCAYLMHVLPYPEIYHVQDLQTNSFMLFPAVGNDPFGNITRIMFAYFGYIARREGISGYPGDLMIEVFKRVGYLNTTKDEFKYCLNPWDRKTYCHIDVK